MRCVVGLLAATLAGCNWVIGVHDFTTPDDAMVALDAMPDARPVVDASLDAAPTEKRIFVSSTITSGAIGSLAAADSICQALADAIPLGGVYKAWLSDDNTDAASRLGHATVPYVLVDGTPVAADWAELVSGTLVHPIDKTEESATPIGTAGACGSGVPNTTWTGTLITGAKATKTCNSWSTDSDNGTIGRFDVMMNEWTDRCTDSCNKSKHLYCVEQ